MNHSFKALALSVLLFLIVACGGDDPAPVVEVPQVATATQPAAVSQQEPAPTAVPATATTQPTLPPPVVATPVPTTTSAPAPTAEPTAAEETIALYTKEDFGSDRNPLTGELVSDPALLQRRPLAVKISNAPPNWVRPQSGLNDADIVFEHITEGALTRLTMIVYGGNPEKMGPIRSARLIDVELPAMYDAALGFSGASIGVSQKLYASDFAERILASGENGYYRTGEEKPYEHTFYARPDGLREALASKGLNRPPTFPKNMAFTSAPPEGGSDANTIRLNYRFEEVVWSYDPTTNYYYRTAAGIPHNDGNTGEQVRARNIVVPFVNHVDDASICEEIRENQCVALSVEIQLWGSGQVSVFRDGRRYDGTWLREGRNDMLTFFDASGNPIPLQIGNSWFELQSPAYQNPLISE